MKLTNNENMCGASFEASSVVEKILIFVENLKEIFFKFLIN